MDETNTVHVRGSVIELCGQVVCHCIMNCGLETGSDIICIFNELVYLYPVHVKTVLSFGRK